mgnify:FL=1
MLEYKEVRRNKRKFLALTSLTDKEFKDLLPYFTQAYAEVYEGNKTHEGKKRKRAVGGGRKSVLEDSEQKLLFILVYQKDYPLQIIMAELFEMSQSSANDWIHRLLPILGKALDKMGLMPERKGKDFAKTEQKQAQKPKYIIDGTERRRQRPKNPEKQALHYSGKKKTHSDKNVLIVQADSKRVSYLSPTHPGKVHDKKVADQAKIRYPNQATLHKDTGFQGYEPKLKRTYQPKKTRPAKAWPNVTKTETVLSPKFAFVLNMPSAVLSVLAVSKTRSVIPVPSVLTSLSLTLQPCTISALSIVNVRFAADSENLLFPIMSGVRRW